MRTPLIALLLVAVLGGCATAGGGGGSANMLTQEQLQDFPGEPVYETLERIRPQWLVSRSGQPNPAVFIDGVHAGALGTLRTLTSGSVSVIRYIAPEAAASRFGSGYEGGVIEVELR